MRLNMFSAAFTSFPLTLSASRKAASSCFFPEDISPDTATVKALQALMAHLTAFDAAELKLPFSSSECMVSLASRAFFNRFLESDLSTYFLLVVRTISLYILSCISYRLIPVEDLFPDTLLALCPFLLFIFARFDHYGHDRVPGSGGRQIGGLVYLVFNGIQICAVPYNYQDVDVAVWPLLLLSNASEDDRFLEFL